MLGPLVVTHAVDAGLLSHRPAAACAAPRLPDPNVSKHHPHTYSLLRLRFKQYIYLIILLVFQESSCIKHSSRRILGMLVRSSGLAAYQLSFLLVGLEVRIVGCLPDFWFFLWFLLGLLT